MKLVLGVNDIPYSHSENLGKSKTGKTRVSMTGEVATILEEKYRVFETFWGLNQEKGVAALTESIEGAFESYLMGAAPPSNVTSGAESEIQDLFKTFLESKAMDGVVNGVPTAASTAGVSHRFKTKRGPARPSFIDTGLYESSFRCKVEG